MRPLDTDFRAALNASKGALHGVKRRMAELSAGTVEQVLSCLGVEEPGALLVLGHMRSGSTLLLHLLLTNPEIGGLGERNAPYRTEADLSRLAIATRLARRAPFVPLRYVADQINHSRFTPNLDLLRHPRVKLLFLLRPPEPSLASLLDLARTYHQAWSAAQAVDYYSARLDDLASYGSRFSDRERAAFVGYEQLTQRPREVLGRLREFLRTRGEFSESYDLHEFTGKRGDPSDNIRSGTIGLPRNLAPVELPAPELARATAAYERCRRSLTSVALVPE
jgi:hypothetical protein